MEERKIIVYDIVGCPQHKSITDVMHLAKKTGYLIWTSIREDGHRSGAVPPYMANPNDIIDKILLDISTEEGRKIYNEITKK